MLSERWGTFSVIDHKDAAALTPEVLMYDRLVLPYPPNEEERTRWRAMGWQPELLDQRLDALGELAIKARWDNDRQRIYTDWLKKLDDVEKDANGVLEEAEKKLPFFLTRRVLMQGPVPLPEGVTHVRRVAAYASEEDLKAHFFLDGDTKEGERTTLGYLLAHRLAIPKGRDSDETLRVAIRLSREDHQFRENRQKLYEWQEKMIAESKTAQDAVAEMDVMVKAYNRCVESAVKDVYYKFAFTLAGIGLGLAGAGLLNPLAAGSALLALVKFAKFDRQPVIKPGENAPAAMFHDVEARYKRFRFA